MPLYRKKPVVITAVQWFKEGDHPQVVKMMSHPEGEEEYSRKLYDAFGGLAEVFYGIRTLEGVMHVTPGDYIICGVAGEYYPCKPDIFEKTYDYVGELS